MKLKHFINRFYHFQLNNLMIDNLYSLSTYSVGNCIANLKHKGNKFILARALSYK